MQNKVIVMTGCASGIGRHLTERLADLGHSVLALDINEKSLKENAKSWPKDKVSIQKVDVRSLPSWKKAFDFAKRKYGRVDILLNVAGYLKPGYIYELDSKEIDTHIDINVKGVLNGSLVASQMFVNQGHGHIINVASLAGIAPIPGLNLYSTSKYAVRGFSLAIAEELIEKGVYVTVVCPDAVATPMLQKQLHYKEAALTFSGGTILTTEDIGDVIIERVIPKKPREVMIPFSRGFLAKIGNTFPSLAPLLAQTLRKKGLREQNKLRMS